MVHISNWLLKQQFWIELSAKKYQQIKNRFDTPFSIWVPSKEWIKENCKTSPLLEKWLKFLPGPYTLIVELKNKKVISTELRECVV